MKFAFPLADAVAVLCVAETDVIARNRAFERTALMHFGRHRATNFLARDATAIRPRSPI